MDDLVIAFPKHRARPGRKLVDKMPDLLTSDVVTEMSEWRWRKRALPLCLA